MIVKSNPSSSQPRKVARNAFHCSPDIWRYQGGPVGWVMSTKLVRRLGDSMPRPGPRGALRVTWRRLRRQCGLRLHRHLDLEQLVDSHDGSGVDTLGALTVLWRVVTHVDPLDGFVGRQTLRAEFRYPCPKSP